MPPRPNQQRRPRQPFKRPQYLPISPSDSVLTTGLMVNPTGAMYRANPNPSTGSFGALGQFGSGLPTSGGLAPLPYAQTSTTNPPLSTPFGGTPSPSQTFQPFGPTRPIPNVQAPATATNRPREAATNPRNMTPARPVPSPTGEGRGDPAMRAIQQNTIAARNDVTNFLMALDTTGEPNFDLLPAKMNQITVSNLQLTPPEMNELGYKLVNGTWAQQNSVQAQQGATTTAAGSDKIIASTDFTETKFYQQYQEEGVSFENQMRWDPKRGQFRKIGDMIRTGDLDVTSPTGKPKKKKKGGGGGARAQVQQQPVAQPVYQAPVKSNRPTSGGSITTSFNTATG